MKKVYGKPKFDKCYACDSQAIFKTKQSYPTCKKHKNKENIEWFCNCGKYLFINESKYGIYFECIDCGKMSYVKAREINLDIQSKKFKINKALKNLF